jgi:zinc/manganese transport system substrate-binding protein
MRINLLVTAFSFFLSAVALGKLNVVTTITDLRSITEEVGGDLISVDSIAKGTQDPHYIEAKPSFMVKANRADLVISIGLDLEVGWLPSIIQGSRNPKINRGQLGFLEVGPLVEALDIPQGNITRADGDVHPFGNPHVWLDPIRAGEVAVHIAKRLGELDSKHADQYLKNAKAFQSRLQEKSKGWQERIQRSGVKSAVTFHKTLTYFLDRYHIENPAILEPKPGVPPTSRHIINVIQIIKTKKVPLILVENFFDPTVTTKIIHEIPTVRSETVAVSVGGDKGINKLEDLYEYLIKAIEKGKGNGRI